MPTQLIALHQTQHSDFAPITPSDTVDEAVNFTEIYVGGAGNISVVPWSNGPAVVFTAVPAGSILRTCGIRVNATLTTATLLVGLR